MGSHRDSNLAKIWSRIQNSDAFLNVVKFNVKIWSTGQFHSLVGLIPEKRYRKKNNCDLSVS